MSSTPFSSKTVNETKKVDEPDLVEFALEDVKLDDSESNKKQNNHVEKTPQFVSETMSRDTPSLKPTSDKTLQPNEALSGKNNDQGRREYSKTICFPCYIVGNLCSDCRARRRNRLEKNKQQDPKSATQTRKTRRDSRDSADVDGLFFCFYCSAVYHDDSESNSGCLNSCAECCSNCWFHIGEIRQCCQECDCDSDWD